jgi:alpha-mannosidase
MKNHPHDDICGCSVDEVHQDMVNRFAHVEQVSQGLQKRLIDYILSAVKFKNEEWGIPLLVMNTMPSGRSSEAHVDVIVPRERFEGKKIALVDSRGRIQYAKIKLLNTFKHPGFWGDREMQRISVSFLAKDIPSMGYKAWYLKESAPGLTANPGPCVSVTKDSLENYILRVNINENGTLDVLHKKTGLHLKGIHYFEDCADAGDEYDFSPILKDAPLTTKSLKASVKTETIGGYKAVAHVSLSWPLPVSLAKDRKSRSTRKTKTPISCEISLLAGERRIEFKTTIDNQIMDHRLRAVFPTTLKTDRISVESKFDVIDRPFTFTAKTPWAQAPLNTRHQEHFASLSDGKNGVSFLNKGLPEYEVQPAKKGADYHLTLLRSVGWLSRADLLTRNGNAGPAFETPEAQCLGKHAFEYAAVFHEGDWEQANIQREAYDYSTPVVAASHYHQVRDWRGPARIPDEAGFVSLNPDSLVLTALKKAEEGDSLVLRFYNPGTKEIEGFLDFGFDIREANLLRLDETPLKKMKIRENHLVFFSIKPKQIMTVEAVWD